MSLPIFPTLPGLTFTVVKTPEFDTLVMTSPNHYEVRIQQMINPIWSWTLIYDFLHDFFWGSFTTVSELRTMMGFFSQVGGKAGSFLFTDPDDYNVGPALVSGTPNTPLAQLSLVTDGIGNWYSPIQRTLNGVFYEDVTDLNGAIAVYLNGTLKTITTDYTVGGPGLALPTASYMGLYIAWVTGFAPWVAAHSYALNAEILDPAGHIQKATTAGTSGATIPTFNDGGGTTPDGTGTLVWTDQGYNPGPTGPVTAEFNFYFRVRFDTDSQDFEKWANTGSAMAATIAGQGGGIYTIGGSEGQNGSGMLKLTTARPAPL